MSINLTSKTQSSLLCSLGGQPQVVTLTLDLLLARGETIDQVLVVYLASDPRCAEAYQRLLGEFSGGRYQGRACRLRGIPVRLGPGALAEARSPVEVDAVWQVFHQTLTDLKANNEQVHLSLSGGRRILSLLGMSAAMLHFTTADRAWHIFTPDETQKLLKDNGMLHAPSDAAVRLIEVPLIPWVTLFPGLREVLATSPRRVQAQRAGWLDDVERARCQQVWTTISERQRQALRAICETSGRQAAATQVGISIGTLDDHKTAIFRACRAAWELESGPDLAFLRRRFTPFLAEQEQV